MKSDELFDPQHLGVVSSCAAVQTLNDGTHITKDGGVHESCSGKKRQKILIKITEKKKDGRHGYIR